MVATERRLGSRRVMTVLGKIPVAPKPINLPSQRGNSVLGSPEGGIPPDATKSGMPDAREEENALKESESLPPTGGKDLAGKEDVGSGPAVGNGTSSSSPSLNRSQQALDSHAKKGDLQNYDSSTSAGISKPAADKASDSLPIESGVTDSRGGVNGSFSRPAVPPPGFEGVGHGPGTATGHNGIHGFQPSVSYHNGTKQREVIVIHMVGNGGFCGNYPVQIGYSAAPPLGNFPLQFGNFEPYFGLPGPPVLDGGCRVSPAPSREFFHDHEEGFVCYEKECSRGGHDRGRHRNGRVLGGIADGAQRDVHEASLSAPVSALASRPNFQKHVFKNPGRTRSAYCNGSVVFTETSPAKPVPGKGFTLLKKACQRKMLVENVHEEVSGGQDPLTEGTDGSDSPASVQNVMVMNPDISVSAKACNGDASLSTSCNAKCLQCNAEAPASRESTGQVNSKITVAGTISSKLDCHFPSKDETITSTEKSACVDGCKVDVKHVIFDADSYQMNALVSEEDAVSNGMTKAYADKESGIKTHKSIKDETSSEKGKQGKSRFSGGMSLTDRKGKHKWLLGVAKVDRKVFAPAWKPKVLPASKASKGIQKSAKQMNESVGDVHDCQKRQSGSVVNTSGSLAPREIYEAGEVMKSKSSGMAQEKLMPCENGLVIERNASACNAKCFHCKAETARRKGSKGQVHDKTEMREFYSCTLPPCCSPTTTEGKPLTPAERTTFVDGCKVDVKHVIFDADSCHVKDSGGVEALTITREATSLKGQNGTDPESFTRKSTQQKTRTWRLNRAMKVEHKGFAPSWKPKSGAARQAKLASKTSKSIEIAQVKSSELQERHSFSKAAEAVCLDPKPSLEGEGPQEKTQETVVEREVHVAVSDGASASASGHKSQVQVCQNRRPLRAAALPFTYCKAVDTGLVASSLSAYVSRNVCGEGLGACMSLVAPSETSKARKVEEEVADNIKDEGTSASDSLEQAQSLSLALENGMAASIGTEAFEDCITSTEKAMGVIGCKVEVKHIVCDTCSTHVLADSKLTSKQEEGTRNLEIKASGWQPGFTKPFCPRTSGQERFHQKVFRKYKETGKWTPKPARQVRGVLDIVETGHEIDQAQRVPEMTKGSHGTGQGKPKAAQEALLADIMENRHKTGQLEPKGGDVRRPVDVMESRHENVLGKSEDAHEDLAVDILKNCHQARQKKPEATHGATVADLMERKPKGGHKAPVPGTMKSSNESKQLKPEPAREAPSADFVGNDHLDQGDSQAPGMCNPEGKASGWQPGFTKPFRPRTPGQERFHQKAFRKHKETGKWKPRANHQAAIRLDNLEKQ